MNTSNFTEKKFGVQRKGTAQDRLNRIRSEQKLKRKIEEKLKTFSERPNPTNSGSASTTDVFIEKFLSDVQRVEFQKNKKTKQRKRKSTADKRLEAIRGNSLEEVPQLSKSEETNCSIIRSGIKSTEKILREGTNAITSTGGIRSYDREPSYSNTENKRSKRSGIAGKRLEKIPKLVLNSSPVKKYDEKSAVRVESSVSEKPIDDECMDVDMVDLSASTSVNHRNEELPEEWLKAEKAEISFYVDQIENLRKEPAYLALHNDHTPDVEMKLSVPCGDLLIVIDTNVFLSHLRFLNSLLKTKNIGSYRSHVLVVPWLVVQEIDCIMKRSDLKLANQARLANSFISECLKKGYSQFFGQSYDDFKVNFRRAVSVDNFIMQYCLKLIQLRNEVILLTNDRNLANKCMFSNVPVFTKEDFDKTFMISNTK